jgi:hypothetical protein
MLKTFGNECRQLLFPFAISWFFHPYAKAGDLSMVESVRAIIRFDATANIRMAAEVL